MGNAFFPGRVCGDEAHGARQEDAARFLMRPGGGARGMRKRNEIEAVPGVNGGKGFADDLVKLAAGHELEDGEFADGDDEAGL